MLNHEALVANYFVEQEIPIYKGKVDGERPIGRLSGNGAFLPSSQMPNRLGEYNQEWQIWGNTWGEAFDLLAAGAAALRDLSGVRRDEGVITRSQIVSVLEEPDPTWAAGPLSEGPRYIAFVRLHVAT